MPFTIKYDDPVDGEVTYDRITKVEGVWSKYGKLTHYRVFWGNKPTEHKHLGFLKLDRVLSVDVEVPELLKGEAK